LPSEFQSGNDVGPADAAEWPSLTFDPADPKTALSQLPASAAVFELNGEDPRAEPYIGRTPNLQSRLARLLQPSPRHPRRLHLAGLVRRIRWRLTGSDFESLLLQFELLQKVHGAKALERMHLRHPAFVRFLGGNPYPRVVVTHRPSQREASWAYGPFASRAAAERYADEMLKLFLLRRCIDDLHPDPSFPGCVYSEMKMCLAPCYKGCSDERYAEEANAVESFLATRGESRLLALRAQRDQASANLEFESAAALHAQVQRVESVRALASDLVRPLDKLRAVILQASANPGDVAVFLFENGTLRGPSAFSTIGMRIQNEQSGSTSLFAQPMAIEPVPEEQGLGIREQGTEEQGTREKGSKGAVNTQHESREALKGHDFSRAITGLKTDGALAPEAATAQPKVHRTQLESRLESVLASLSAPAEAPSAITRQGHLGLLKRWYYRPEIRRTGEIFFPDAEERWPIRSILRGIGRVAAKSLSPTP
jgi:excinuclease ABC subunit C